MEFLVEILTAREFEILRLRLAERTTGKIAEILHVSPRRWRSGLRPIECDGGRARRTAGLRPRRRVLMRGQSSCEADQSPHPLIGEASVRHFLTRTRH
jgi:hypothetical protein